MRKDHKKTNKNDEILDAYDETSNGTIPNCTSKHLKSNKAFQKSVKTSVQQQQQLNANNINDNSSVGTIVNDSNKNPIILTSEGLEFPVHECVFKGDVRRLSSLIRTHSISQKDVHGKLSAGIFTFTHAVFVLEAGINVCFIAGNTPLHLAVMLGHKGNDEL